MGQAIACRIGLQCLNNKNSRFSYKSRIHHSWRPPNVLKKRCCDHSGNAWCNVMVRLLFHRTGCTLWDRNLEPVPLSQVPRSLLIRSPVIERISFARNSPSPVFFPKSPFEQVPLIHTGDPFTIILKDNDRAICCVIRGDTQGRHLLFPPYSAHCQPGYKTPFQRADRQTLQGRYSVCQC